MSDSILLENGRQFHGVWRAHRKQHPVGEAVFNTSMCGYQEILTDPSYSGQIVTMTCPQIGNYGVNLQDVESSAVHVRAFIVRELAEIHSNFTSQGSLEQYLDARGIACMTEVDTRALTRIIRNHGAMKCTFMLEGEPVDQAMQRMRSFNYEAIDFSAAVAGRQDARDYVAPGRERLPLVAVLDFGIKSNILRLLSKFCNFEIFTCDEFAGLKDIQRFAGFFLSNGPGDPAAVAGATQIIQRMLDTQKPLFGICLGHQLLCLALGGRTYKLKFGHRGANHPVKNLLTGRVEISSQNHGYAVYADSFKGDQVVPTHVNLNDGSLAGVMLRARIDSQNTFPRSTGLSSSSSGLAALTLAAAEALGLSLTKPQLSVLARQGSGSACRSIPEIGRASCRERGCQYV